MKLFTRWAGVTAVALSLAIVACQDPVPPVTLAGQWQAPSDPAQTIFTDATLFSFSFTQSGSELTGTWGATGADGAVVVRPDQAVVGEIRDAAKVELQFSYDRVAHGCTGPSRECYPLTYRLLGVVTPSGAINGDVTGPPLPGTPSTYPVLARWTLVKR